MVKIIVANKNDKDKIVEGTFKVEKNVTEVHKNIWKWTIIYTTYNL